MARIPPAYPQYSQPPLPPPPYPQYMPQYPPPPPPPQQYNPYPPKPQRPTRTKIYYRDPPKPSNAIFIKNIPYDLSNEEFQNIYSKFGEIASITNIIKDKGIAFITYYSILSAIDAVEKMRDVKILDRCPVTLFSFRPPPYSGKDPKDTSTIVEVQPIQPTNQILAQDQVSLAMAKYGQIYQIREIGPNQITVQFCDMRCAKNAAENGACIDINGIQCKVELYVEPVGDAVILPQQYPQSRIPPGPPPPSQMQMPQQIPPTYQQIPPSYQPPPPQQMSQMPMPPPPPPQYPQQMQMPPPQYAPPQQMQPYQYGQVPSQMTSPPHPPPLPTQQQNSPPSNSPPYPNYSPNQPPQQDLAASLLNSVLK